MNIKKIYLNTAKKHAAILIIGSLCAGIAIYLGFKIPFINQAIIDDAISKKDANLLVSLVIVLILFSISEYLIKILKTYIFTKTAKELTKSIYSKVIENLNFKNHYFFVRQSSSDIASMVSEISELEELFSPQFFSALCSCFTLLGSIIILFNINFSITLITLFGLAISSVFVFLSNKFIQKHMSNLLNKKAFVNSKIYEIILGIFEIRSNEASNFFKERCKKAIGDKCSANLKFSLGVTSLTNASSTFISMLLVWILYVYGMNIITSELTIGSYFLIISYVQKIIDPIMQISLIMGQIKPIFVTSKRIEEKFTVLPNDFSSEKCNVFKNIENISLRDICYRYPDNTENTIANFNLNIRKGHVALIKGANGSGKTTLLNILCGELKNYSGEILFDNKILNSQNHVSIVRQIPYIFNISLKENIILAEKFEAEKYLGILDTFCFEDYFDDDILSGKKIIEENGKSLSGGQIKLIALARAFYRNRSILIFDEAISNLDKKLKKVFVNFIEKIKNNHIIILVEHTDEFKNLVDIEINISCELRITKGSYLRGSESFIR
ncbi:MAG: ATP-binding cassette domain-containing protein [Oscillospiraceae bacterium]|jgi:ABC-type bacteriocin/lantibiotic exporter with double-glycine peptidase domain|nr:ATP-binding cassette domain-containing protein [Oscillospiraceae bacterium]